MKNHLKRLAAPRTWIIDRKKNKFITRPKPGPHSLAFSLPLGNLLRDFLKHTQTIRETQKLLRNQEVFVDGKRRKDYRLPIGLFDVLSLPLLKENFRLLLDRQGRLFPKKIDSAESHLKPCKVIGKVALPEKIQLNLHDGRNILVSPDFKCRVGDTLLLNLPDQKIKETLELKKDAFVFLIKGKHAGDSGLLQEIKGDQVIYQRDDQKIETLKKYLFVLGEKKPLINIDLKPKSD